MKIFLLISSVTLFTYSFAYSQTKSDDIKELFRLMQTEQNVDHTMTNMADMIKQQIKGQIPDEGKFKEYMDYMIDESGKVTKKMVYTDMVTIYDNNFTHQEIKDFILFYKTPSGQKMIAKEPRIQQELMEMMSKKYMPELQAKFRAKLAELNQK